MSIHADDHLADPTGERGHESVHPGTGTLVLRRAEVSDGAPEESVDGPAAEDGVEALLLDTHLDLDVQGLLGELTLTQTFRNTTDRPLADTSLVTSDTHRLDTDGARIVLADAPMDRDLVLAWPYASGTRPSGEAFVATHRGEGSRAGAGTGTGADDLVRIASRPWPWADVVRVARLEVPDAGITRIVLQDASGEAMAFGPGLVAGTPERAAGTTVALGGHRDSHLAFLEHLELGAALVLEDRNGVRHAYRLASTRVVDSRDGPLSVPMDRSSLVLVTCWPVRATQTGGPLRLVAVALPRGGTPPDDPSPAIALP